MVARLQFLATGFGLGLTALVMAFVMTLALAPAAHAQTGTVVGTVQNAAGAPVLGVDINIPGTGFRTVTGPQGNFRIDGVPAGTYQLRAFQLGYREARIEGIQVRPGAETRANVRLESLPIALSGVVVSPGRRAQRQTEAPATVTRIEAAELANLAGGSFASALKQVKGLDFIQVGVSTAAVNARGFNSSFNNRMLMMEDGRIAVLPENGLPVGPFTPIPMIDLASMEILVGPGAALYGPDASGGVISLQSKDPRDFPGASAMLTGGSRGYLNAQVRQAGTSGDWGYKVTGEFHRVDDFENRLNYGSAATPSWEVGTGGNPSATGDSGVDWQNRVLRGQGLLAYYMEDSRLELGVGASQSSGVGQTNVGRNQLDGWTYNYLQLRYTTPNWFLNAYRAQSQAGDSYALNRYTSSRAANPTLSDDEVRLMSDWPSDGRLYAAEMQNRWTIEALRGSDLTWGIQARRDVVSSDRQWLTDRLTGEDVSVSQLGIYGQLETPVTADLRLVVGARVDEHENYDTQVSPKAALVWSPRADQAVRLSVNRAFKSPTILQTNFWIPNFVPLVGVFHNTEGYSIRNGAGVEVHRLDPLVAESNVTWELGYRGVLGSSFLLDVAAYRASYEDFLSPLTIFANPFGATIFSATPTTAFFAGSGDPVVDENGGPQIPLTYWNMGDAEVRGMDLGATWIMNPRVDLKTTLSFIELTQQAEGGAQVAEATALNSPGTKWSVGVEGRDFGGFGGGASVRYVNGYTFTSGINRGEIPTHAGLDLSLRYRFAGTGLTVNATAQNLLACGSDVPDGERECGFDQRHIQMINMPAIGSVFLVGMRWGF
ncbi:hypothetical protein BH23GEM11_BH23GEM11_18150 [soil metagenome]